MAEASSVLSLGFIALSVLVAGLFLGASHGIPRPNRRLPDPRVVLGVWMLLTAVGASLGIFRFEPIPTALMLFVVGFALTTVWVLSSQGKAVALRTPLWALVGFQAFRIPVELLIHRAYLEGLAPIQMTYEGLNFDILSGLSALFLAAALSVTSVPHWLVIAWNCVGLGLLATILTIAILSSPIPIQVFHAPPQNLWVTRFPWVWLPTVLVSAALMGHLLVFQALALTKAPPKAT